MTDSAPAFLIDGRLIDGRPATGLPLDDRGLAYGDGLFETVLLHRGEPVWWQAHLDRMRLGAARLHLPMPELAVWEHDLATLLAAVEPQERGVAKLILTRGGGGRGYAPPEPATPQRILSWHPAPPDRPAWRQRGIAVRWCETRLAVQPLLAGIKHLNRLEQVLARAEWRDPGIDEGLLSDTEGNAVCATAANLFVVAGGRLLTPPVERCGVAGVCRRFLLAECGAVESCLSPEAVLAADEVFVCSSLRGILPVSRLGDRQWPVGPTTRGLLRRLAAAQPAFAFDDLSA